MATTPKKKTAGGGKSGSRSSSARSGARSGKGTGSRSSSRKAPAKRPIRREVTGVVFLILALCVFFSYFNQDGWLIVLLPTVLKGLFGFGYFLVAPALAAASWILLTHKGRPVALRTASALLVPYLFGGVWHMLFCREDLSSPDGLLGKLWTTGGELYSGGVLSGGTAQGFLAVLGKPASVVIFCVLILVLLMVVFQISFSTLWQMWKERERLDYRVEDYEDEEEFFQPMEEPRAAKPAPRPARPHAPRPEIDIPLDDDEEPARERKGGVLSGFFKPRDKGQMTPADVLTGSAPNGNAPAQPQEEPQPAPVPAPPPEPVPIQEPEFQEEPPVETRRRKKDTVGEVEAATAQVAAEIASGMAVEKTYDFPPITLLDQNRQDNYIEAGAELRTNAQRLADTLRSFGVDATGGDVIRGPAITRYEFVLDQGVKLSKITNLADDIALALGASGVRIAPIPEKISVVGIEVPNKTVSPVLIRDVIESRAFTQHKSSVAFAVGRDIGNKDIVGDIAKLPHVLIAGTTGSGKSVCTNSLIISLLYKSSPEDVRFIMVDPKMVELAPYNGIPHLLIPVVTDPKKAAGALQWAVYEMMKRYKTFSELGVKKLEEYNALAAQREDLPHMASVVVVIDELADLMLVAAKEVEESICRVAQMGRAALPWPPPWSPGSFWTPPARRSWWAVATCSTPLWAAASPSGSRAASSPPRRSTGWWATSSPPERPSTPTRSCGRSRSPSRRRRRRGAAAPPPPPPTATRAAARTSFCQPPWRWSWRPGRPPCPCSSAGSSWATPGPPAWWTRWSSGDTWAPSRAPSPASSSSPRRSGRSSRWPRAAAETSPPTSWPV